MAGFAAEAACGDRRGMSDWISDCGTAMLVCGDCLDVLPRLSAGRMDAVVVDPPYNIGKAAWDKIDDYLPWCERWIAAASTVCKRQGAFWCFHSEPLVLADIARIIERQGRPLQNWVTWDKYAPEQAHSQLYAVRDNPGNRSFAKLAEYIVYHADDGQWTAQSDECRGFIFEPLRAYLAGEVARAGLTTRKVAEAFQRKTGSRTVTGMAGHWLERVQWSLPTADNYEWLRSLLNAQGGDYLRREYDDLRREYDDLRREYEHLRPTFNNPGKVSSVWQFPPAKANGHATPKPVELIERIIETTTNSGDTVMDCFAGSGTTGVACVNTGRRFIGIEIDPGYFEIAKRRIQAAMEKRQQQLIPAA